MTLPPTVVTQIFGSFSTVSALNSSFNIFINKSKFKRTLIIWYKIWYYFVVNIVLFFVVSVKLSYTQSDNWILIFKDMNCCFNFLLVLCGSRPFLYWQNNNLNTITWLVFSFSHNSTRPINTLFELHVRFVGFSTKDMIHLVVFVLG